MAVKILNAAIGILLRLLVVAWLARGVFVCVRAVWTGAA